MGARKAAAQRAISKGPSLVVPKAAGPLRSVAPVGVKQVVNDTKGPQGSKGKR